MTGPIRARCYAIPLAAAVLVAITACSSSSPDVAGNDPSTTHPSSAASHSQSPAPTTSAAPTPGPTPLPTATDAKTVDSGDVVGTIGEPVGLRQNGAEAFTLTINEITFADTCPSRLGGTVEADEQFLILDVTATMSSDYTDEDLVEPFIATSADTFTLWDENGQHITTAHSVKAFECFETTDQLTPVVYPGDEFTGKVALETPATSGRIIYNPWGVDGSGWAWDF